MFVRDFPKTFTRGVALDGIHEGATQARLKARNQRR
jgi:hypothetical protein